MKPLFPMPQYEEMYSMTIGGVLAAAHNYTQRRPIGARGWLWAAYIGGGFLVGNWIAKYSKDRILAREVYLHEYVRTHPDDFPELTQIPKKYRDVFEDWHPVR